MSGTTSQALAMYRLLQTGASIPHGTAHLVADVRLCLVVAREVELPADFVVEACRGLPVKEVYAMSKWVTEKPLANRPGSMAGWVRNRHGRWIGREAYRAASLAARKKAEGERRKKSAAPGRWDHEDERTREQIVASMGGGR